jgi:hypothetical protein
MESQRSNDAPRDIAFVFNNVDNYQSLAAAFREGVEVHVLDAQRDGLEQIAAILAGRSGIEELHVIGHGAPGTLQLGTLWLDSANLGAHQDVLRQIGDALTPGGDILLYGCDVAAGAAGAQFVGQIAKQTGADVAASLDATGGDARGGNWTLEYRQGEIGATAGFDGGAVRGLDTLLALPASGIQNVTGTMDLTPGNFVPGFTLGATVAVQQDPGTGTGGDGLYFDSPADQDLATKDATFTVQADKTNLGSFDLTWLDFDKYSGGVAGAFMFTVTGYDLDDTVKATINIHSNKDATGYDTTPDFTAFKGIVKYTVRIVSETLINGGTAYPVSDWTFDSFTIVNPHGLNVTTTFIGGNTLDVSQGSSANDAAALLHVSDTDGYQTLTWTQKTGPSHGTLSISGASAAGGSTDIAPGGSISYTPTAGYLGSDTFTIKVYDGLHAVEKQITVNVGLAKPGTPDLTAGDSGASSTDNITNASTLTFQGTGTAGDSSSTVQVFLDKDGSGSYTAGDVTTTVAMINGTWNTSLSTSGLVDGDYKVYAQTSQTINSVTYTSPVSSPLTVTVDKTAPTLAINSSKSTLGPGETATVTFAFSEDPGSTFDGTDIVTSGGTLSGLTTTGSTRTATFTAGAGSTAGIQVFASTYSDKAGNNGTAASISMTISDTTPPNAPASLKLAAGSDIGDSTTDGLTSVNQPTVTGKAEAGATVTLYDTNGSAVIGTGTAGGTGDWSIPTDTLRDGVHSITAKATDAAGNTSVASSPITVTIDTAKPTVTISSGHTGTLKAGDSATVTFVFSDNPGTGFDASKVKVVGGSLSNWGGTELERTATFTPDANGEGTASISVNGGQYADAAGNGNDPSASYTLVYDTKAPTLTISSSKYSFGIGDTATISFTFSEAPTGFSADDIVTDKGTLSALTQVDARTWTAIFTPDPDSSGTASITVAGGSYTDAAGNSGGVGTTPVLHFDTLAPLAPTVRLDADSDSGAVGDAITNDTTPTLTGSAEAGTTVTVYDNGGIIGTTVATEDNTWSFTTAGLPDRVHSFTATATDAQNNSGLPSGALDIIIDSTKPTLSLTSDVAQLKAGQPATITFHFSEDPGASFTAGDIAVTNGTLSDLAGGGLTWTATVTPDDGVEGSAVVTVASGKYSDEAGNPGAADASLTLSVDSAAPTLEISSDKPALKAGASATITFEFSEDVTGFTDTDIVLAGGGTLDSFTGSGKVYTAIYTPPADSGGSASISVAGAAYSDGVGNAGAVGKMLLLPFDTLAPHATVTLDHAMLARGQTAQVTVDFGETVTGFDDSHVTAANGTLGGFASTDGGRTWTATLTPSADVSDATNVITVSNAGVLDAAGNAGTGTSTSPNYQVQTAAPVAVIEMSDTHLLAGETSVVTIRFGQAVNDFTLADLHAENGALSGLASSDGGSTWTATFTPAANLNDTTNIITVANTGVTSQGGDAGVGTSDSANYEVLTVRPTASINVAQLILAPGAQTGVTITFSEAVTGFDNADLGVTNATLSPVASTDGGKTWTATLTAGTNVSGVTGRVTLNLPGVQNLEGNAGTGTVASGPYVVGPLTPPGGGDTMSGGLPKVELITDPATGQPAQLITVPLAPSAGTAQVGLGTSGASGGNTLTAALPAGVGLKAAGPLQALDNVHGLQDLIARIDGSTAPGTATQTQMKGLGTEFVNSLGTGVMLETKTVVMTVGAGAGTDKPIVISGTPPAPGANSPAVGLVIDGHTLPQGAVIQLDNIDFAAVIGNVRLFGGEGRNMVVGDGASQVIYLGPDDDVLNGGAGDDFVGSAGGNDTLDGGDGNDLVAGGIGNDKVLGSAGNDVLQGGRSTTGSWDFYVSANGAITARHSGAVFSQSGTEMVQGSELDASVAELGFLKADPQQLAGIALLYDALGRTPDLGGLSFWSRPGISLNDVAKGVLGSAEFFNGPLGQSSDEAYLRGVYQQVLGRAPEASGLAWWLARLAGTDGHPAASRIDVLTAVALSSENKTQALGADGYKIGAANIKEAAWFGGSGDDLFNGGPGNDVLVGGDGVDTAVFAGKQADYRILVGADHQLRVVQSASGDVDTLSGIEAARFDDCDIDLGFMKSDPALVNELGMLYQAVLDRAGDAGGFGFWLSHGLNAQQLVQAFTQTAEFQSHFAGMNDNAFVHALYANSGLASTAAGGEQSWQAYLSTHTRAQLVAAWIAQDDVVHAQFGTAGLWLV